MRRAVFWSADALDDLDRIIGYIAADNPAAAAKVLIAIRKAGDDLGELATGRPGRVPGTYEKVLPRLRYILAYALEALPEGGERVIILRAIHGARKWATDEWPE